MQKALVLKNPKDPTLLGLSNYYLSFVFKELMNAVTAVTKPVSAIINPTISSMFKSIGEPY